MISHGRITVAARRAATGLVLLVAVVLAPAGAAGDDTEQRAVRFVENLADAAVHALTEPDISRDEREKRFRGLLSDHFAVGAIGQWVLGRYWTTATVEERKEYLRLFEEMLVVTYLNRFQRYSGETLAVDRALVDERSGDAVVFSQIVRPDGTAVVTVGWRLRASGSSFKIVDVMVEGVSMGQTQRSEFAAVIRRHGGKVSGLLAEMRERVKGNA
ncbi:MAG: phospholipid-binding protein MlaC [Rhodospirillales bacterium]